MPRHARILVVDDEEFMRDSCAQILSKVGYQVDLASTAEEALQRMGETAFEIIILDLRLPDRDGMELLQQLRETFPETIIVVITGYATIESAVEAMKRGAFDFLPKPFTPDALRMIVRRAEGQCHLQRENLSLRTQWQTREQRDEIIGESAAIRQIKTLIEKIGPSDSTVLIEGESGTGKELVARAIHRSSPRSHRPMFTVDCSALVETLLESELFGHVKGAFTGAHQTKHGRFELADGSTLFFDEIGNMSLEIQAKLLRVLQTREFTRVGSSQAIQVDVRIIAATNRDLFALVQQGAFREDLYYRLNVVPIHLPPLRERREDIPLLAQHFLEKYALEKRRDVRGFSQKAMEMLSAYEWPGNVRELENVIECAVVLAEHEVLQPEDLCYLHRLEPSEPVSPEPSLPPLKEVEKQYLQKVLDDVGWNLSEAARVLGIDRKTLRLKIRRYEIERP